MKQNTSWFDFRRVYDSIATSAPDGCTIVEIGTWLGESIIYIGRALKSQGKQCRLVGVDTFAGQLTDPAQIAIVNQHGGSIRAAFDANIANAGIDVEVMQCDSAEASKAFKKEEVWCVFVDGDHSATGVTRDLEAWRHKVSQNGIIAGHDIDCQDVKNAVDLYFSKWQIVDRCWIGHQFRQHPTLLSVLIPTISQRAEEANALFNRLELQAAPYPVEILMLRDNKRGGIGEARNKLLRAASGKYITFIDDDDDFADDYFETVLPMLYEQTDVISYNQRADIDGAIGEVHCSLKHDNMPFVSGQITRRKPWFWCAWSRELAMSHAVPKVNAQEDVLWLRHLWAEAETEIHIPKILHHYNFRSDKTTLQ